jgi:hypothetical protein
VFITKTNTPAQVLHKVVTVKTIHSMAMDFKIAPALENVAANKSKMRGSKNNDAEKKNNIVVMDERLRHIALCKKLLVPWRSATAKLITSNKPFTKHNKKNFVDNDKKKPITKRSSKKGATECVHLVAILKIIVVNPTMKMSKDKINVNTLKATSMTVHLQDKDFGITTTMMNNASASSSSQCQSFPEAMIPKTTCHGPSRLTRSFASTTMMKRRR